jgi:uncharacterized protein YbjT (DUF2867 family)
MYVVTGVTGNTGSIVATTLLAAKQPVRVVVRDAAKGEVWKSRGAEVAIADVGDQAALAKALTGAKAAYILLPPPAWGQGGLAADRAAKTKAIAGAVQAAKPGHVVLLSSVGANHAAGTGPIKDVRALEHALAATGVAATFLRAAYFMDNWASMLKGAIDGGALYYGATDGLAFAQVATEDIGKTAAKLLVEAAPAGTRVVELAGPKDYTLADAAAAIAKASGKPVKAVTVPIPAVVQSLVGIGASQEFADGMGELTDGLNKGLLVFEHAPIRGTVSLDDKISSLLAR